MYVQVDLILQISIQKYVNNIWFIFLLQIQLNIPLNKYKPQRIKKIFFITVA